MTLLRQPSDARTRIKWLWHNGFMLHAPALFVVLALAAGTALAHLDVAPGWALMALCVAGVVAVVYALSNCSGRSLKASAWLCFCAAAALRAHTRFAQPWPKEPLAPLGAATAQVRAELVGPVRDIVAIEGSRRQRVLARLVAYAHDGRWRPLDGCVVLYLWPADAVATGDEIVVPLRLRAAPQPRNGGDETSLQWARRTGLRGRAQVMGPHIVAAFGPRYLRALDLCRQRCARNLQSMLGAERAALARALALGDPSAIDDVTRERWAQAGMAHLLSVSGLHVAFIMGATGRSFRLLFGRRLSWQSRGLSSTLEYALALVAGLFFVALSGAGWAAMRAVVMAALLVAGHLVGRRPSGLQALCCAGATLLWAWPRALREVGFVMSFAAVAGLVLWLRPPRARRRYAPQPQSLLAACMRRGARYVQDAAYVCGAAQLATAPLCAAYFGRLVCLGACINLAAVPLAGICVGLCLLCAFLGPHLGRIACVPTAMGLDGLLHLAQWASAWPLASVWVPGHSGLFLGGLALLMMGVTALRCAPSRRGRRLGAGVSTAALVCLAATYVVEYQHGWRRAQGPLMLDHLYVGQGDATLVTFPKGMTMLVDGGGATRRAAKDPGRAYVSPALSRRGVRRIDVMVLTHPHPDHLGGLLYVAEHFAVGALWLNGDGLHYRDVQTLIALVKRRGGRVGPPPRHWQVQGATLTSHMPLAGAWASANDHSLVLRLQMQTRSIVLAGDIEGRAEAMLAEVLAPADVLKVGHHGSRTSSSTAFLRAINPAAAIISCGEDNTFGFPHAETLAHLEAQHSRVWRTDTMGAVHLETRGKVWHASGPDGAEWRF